MKIDSDNSLYQWENWYITIVHYIKEIGNYKDKIN